MLVRDGERGVEVLMLLRSPAVEFSPGAYVFPGGALDASDRDAESARLCVGRTDRDASAALGLHAGGLAFWLAAVRECFEEAGVLLANDRAGRPVSFADTEHRRPLSLLSPPHERRGARTSPTCAETEGSDASTSAPSTTWPTGSRPRGAPRRYDTRFLLAAAPAGQEPLHDDGEAVASLWITPREALNRNAAGEYELIRPTLETLEALGRFRSCAELLEAIALMGRCRSPSRGWGRGARASACCCPATAAGTPPPRRPVNNEPERSGACLTSPGKGERAAAHRGPRGRPAPGRRPSWRSPTARRWRRCRRRRGTWRRGSSRA